MEAIKSLGTQIDHNGFLVFRGRPMLPLFTYCAETAEAMEESKQAGFSCAFYGPKDPADRFGLPAIAAPDAGYEDGDVLANFTIDKPDFYRDFDGSLKFPPSWVKERVKDWKAKQPHIPTVLHLYTRASDALTAEYLEAGADIIGLDFWLARAGWSLSVLPLLLENLKRLIRMHKKPASKGQAAIPLWVGLQVSQTDIPVIGQDIPFATAEQYRTMVYMCLAHGVTGIGCWAYEYSDGATPDGQQHRAVLKDTVPELWQGIATVNREVREMESALTQPTHMFEANRVSVHYRVITSPTEICVLAVEELGVPQWAEIAIPGLPGITAVSGIAYPGARSCRFTGDSSGLSLREFFPAFQARAYRLFLHVTEAGWDEPTMDAEAASGPPRGYPCGWDGRTIGPYTTVKR